MRSYIIRRFLYMIVILFAVSIVAFIIIQLPPGDWLTNLIMRSIAIGGINEEQISLLERRYGLDLPVYAQYAKWRWNMLHGDFGRFFEFNEPVSKLIGKRLPLTVAISMITLLFVYAVLAFNFLGDGLRDAADPYK